MEWVAVANLRAVVKIKSWKSPWLWVALAPLALLPVAPRSAVCQKSADGSDSSAAKNPPTSEKVRLNDVTRVSTEAVSRQAAKERAKDDKSSNAKPQNDSTQNEASAPAVSELNPAAKRRDNTEGPDQLSTEDGGTSRLDKVHGSVQGATGAGARAGAAELGVGGKSGKAHVYVKTEQSRTDAPTPP
jgi:hypothetical protein